MEYFFKVAKRIYSTLCGQFANLPFLGIVMTDLNTVTSVHRLLLFVTLLWLQKALSSRLLHTLCPSYCNWAHHRGFIYLTMFWHCHTTGTSQMLLPPTSGLNIKRTISFNFNYLEGENSISILRNIKNVQQLFTDKITTSFTVNLFKNVCCYL